jgi:hypothetical protein
MESSQAKGNAADQKAAGWQGLPPLVAGGIAGLTASF